MRLSGAKELDRKLQRLPAKAEKKVWRQGLRAGAKVVQSAVKARSPRRSGRMASSVKVRAMKRSRNRIGILVQSGKGFFKGDDFYAGFQELGFHIGSRKLGNKRRFVEGRHFFEEGFDISKQEALNATLANMKAGVEREAAAT